MIITTLVLLKLTEVGLEEGEGWVGLRGWGVGRDSGGRGGLGWRCKYHNHLATRTHGKRGLGRRAARVQSYQDGQTELICLGTALCCYRFYVVLFSTLEQTLRSQASEF